MQALVVIATTYSIEVLNFSAFDSGLAFLIFVFFSAIGCYIPQLSLKRINPIKSDQLSIIFLCVFTTLAVAFISSVERRSLYFVFAIFWGLAGMFVWILVSYLNYSLFQTKKATFISHHSNTTAGWKYTIGMSLIKRFIVQ